MSALRREVLRCFKLLHQTSREVFDGDFATLQIARKKINEEFQSNKNLCDEDTIKQKINLANEVAKELRANVIQAVETKPGVFEAKIRKETTRLDNYPFDPNANIPTPRSRKCK